MSQIFENMGCIKMIAPEKRHVFSISELNRSARYLLEDRFPSIWVEGEISNLIQHSSGHWYFSLKDNAAQVRCAMFRGVNQHLNFKVDNGISVLVKAKVSLYENRGDFQLIVDHMEEVGFGALQRKFEALKNKLEKQGLFALEHKKSLPEYPSVIGVITSPTGAAIRDILHVLKRRYPIANVIIYPTLVQGDQAANQIVEAIQTANHRKECDVIILARGGGSLEDLWPFNEESVAMAIFESALPVVTGIGHEVDFTIADFVADVRAPTPSAAAEAVSPDQETIINYLSQLQKRMIYGIQRPVEQIKKEQQNLKKRLMQCHPKNQMEQQSQRMDRCEKALIQAQNRIVENKKNKLATLARALNAISPLNTLERGYSILMDKNNHIVYKTNQVNIGDEMAVRLSDGMIGCQVLRARSR
jgi:exodeoxyribonuclease VII large subunit